MNATQFREIFHVLHNIDRWELQEAGIISPQPADGERDTHWIRFNDDLTTFVLKLDPPQLAALLSIVKRRAPSLSREAEP